LCSEEAKAIQIDLEETALLAQSPVEVEVAEAVDNISADAANEAEASEAEIAETEASTAPEPEKVEENAAETDAIAEDDIPLASEVEIPEDVAKEAKSQSSEKNN